jgi:hypothetical protein
MSFYSQKFARQLICGWSALEKDSIKGKWMSIFIKDIINKD